MPRFAFFSSLPTVVLELLDETISAEVTPHIKTMGVLPERIQNAATVAAD